MIQYDLFLNGAYSAQLNVLCVTVPLYLLHAFKRGALDDKYKFEKYVLIPFRLKNVALSGEDLGDELANLLTIEGHYLAIIDHHAELDQDVKNIFENDIQLQYGLDILKGMVVTGADVDPDLECAPCIPSYAKSIGALKEIYSVNIQRDVYQNDWQDFFTNYASYAIEMIITGQVNTDLNPYARKTMGTKMIQSAIKALIGEHDSPRSTWAIRTYSDMSTIDDLYGYLTDHVFRDVSDPEYGWKFAIDNCAKAGRLLMTFFTMAVFPICNYDNVCTNFLKAKLSYDDYAIYNTEQNQYQDLVSSGLMTLDAITSYYFPILCSEIVLRDGKRSGVPGLKSYMFSPLAYLVVTSTLREFGFTSASSKAIYIRCMEDTSDKAPTIPCHYPGLYTLLEFATKTLRVLDYEDKPWMTPMDIAWKFVEYLPLYWATIPLPHKYILVANYLPELLATKAAGNLINTDPKLYKKYNDISTAAELISGVIDTVPEKESFSEFEAALKETLIAKYGALNAATYVNLISSDFVDFVNNLVMTRIMY